MVHRSTLQSVVDEAAFPVRVKALAPSGGFGRLLDDAYIWLDREVGRTDFAWHPATMFPAHAVAFHLRDVEPARRFLGASPTWSDTPNVGRCIWHNGGDMLATPGSGPSWEVAAAWAAATNMPRRSAAMFGDPGSVEASFRSPPEPSNADPAGPDPGRARDHSAASYLACLLMWSAAQSGWRLM